MNKFLVFIFFLSAFLIAFFAGSYWRGKFFVLQNENLINKIISRPFDAYTIEKLSSKAYPSGKLNLNSDNSTFSFEFQPNPESKSVKTTTGTITIPERTGKLPLVLMIRGYVDQEIYTPGIGTKHAAEVFNKNGYITIAPDFLGYAGSSPNAENVFESRFQTYTTILSILNSLDQIEKWDGKNLFIWAHSNGGQIALTSLEITRKSIPTTLWTPVSKPFPYNVLYYTDEADDKGKLVRRELAKFEDIYDTDKYSIDNYYSNIVAPIQLHQGTVDDAVPVEWSRRLNKTLKALDKDINYFEYSGSDHNLQPAWNTVIQRDLEFFRKNTK
ncbi:prolyl oligopeptidase family serine peptidase [Candidatus Microgenomates bacterium]|nr:prolyl oligopeptidase family serine peptidase [Candidatus Microgenomates bacterium]